MHVVGIHLKAGYMYLAVVSDPKDSGLLAEAVLGASPRMEPSAGLTPVAQVADFLERTKQELRTVKPQAAVWLATRLHAGWKYTDAVSRISMLTAFQLACNNLQIPCAEIKTERVGKLAGLKPNELETISPNRFGFEKIPRYWKAGLGEAYSAAAGCLAAELESA